MNKKKPLTWSVGWPDHWWLECERGGIKLLWSTEPPRVNRLTGFNFCWLLFINWSILVRSDLPTGYSLCSPLNSKQRINKQSKTHKKPQQQMKAQNKKQERRAKHARYETVGKNIQSDFNSFVRSFVGWLVRWILFVFVDVSFNVPTSAVPPSYKQMLSMRSTCHPCLVECCCYFYALYFGIFI